MLPWLSAVASRQPIDWGRNAIVWLQSIVGGGILFASRPAKVTRGQPTRLVAFPAHRGSDKLRREIESLLIMVIFEKRFRVLASRRAAFWGRGAYGIDPILPSIWLRNNAVKIDCPLNQMSELNVWDSHSEAMERSLIRSGVVIT